MRLMISSFVMYVGVGHKVNGVRNVLCIGFNALSCIGKGTELLSIRPMVFFFIVYVGKVRVNMVSVGVRVKV